MEYSFDIEEAQSYGLAEAIMLKNFKFWIRKNIANKKNYWEVTIEIHGKQETLARHWTYNSTKAYTQLFPFWTEKQIRRIIESLQNQGVLIHAQLKKSNYDRTNWYALYDESQLFTENNNNEKPNQQDDAPKGDSIRPNGRIDTTKKSHRDDQSGDSFNTDNKQQMENTDINIYLSAAIKKFF